MGWKELHVALSSSLNSAPASLHGDVCYFLVQIQFSDLIVGCLHGFDHKGKERRILLDIDTPGQRPVESCV